MNVGNVVEEVARFYLKHTKVINTIGIGVGVIGTGVLSGKAGIKAHKILEQKRNERKKDKRVQEDLSTKEKIKSTWKVWVPTIVCGISTISLAVLNTCQMNYTIQKLTANIFGLTALCSDKDEILKKYREVTNEVLQDNEKIEEIEKKVIKKDVEDAIKNIDENVVCAEGEFICVDALSGRVFSTTEDRIKKAEALIQKTLMIEDCCSLNDLYQYLGLEETIYGDSLGWVEFVDMGASRDWRINIKSLMRDGKPVGVIRYPLPEPIN